MCSPGKLLHHLRSVALIAALLVAFPTGAAAASAESGGPQYTGLVLGPNEEHLLTFVFTQATPGSDVYDELELQVDEPLQFRRSVRDKWEQLVPAQPLVLELTETKQEFPNGYTLYSSFAIFMLHIPYLSDEGFDTRVDIRIEAAAGQLGTQPRDQITAWAYADIVCEKGTEEWHHRYRARLSLTPTAQEVTAARINVHPKLTCAIEHLPDELRREGDSGDGSYLVVGLRDDAGRVSYSHEKRRDTYLAEEFELHARDRQGEDLLDFSDRRVEYSDGFRHPRFEPCIVALDATRLEQLRVVTCRGDFGPLFGMLACSNLLTSGAGQLYAVDSRVAQAGKAAAHYAAAGSATPQPPYTNRSAAARTIQDALDVAKPGSLVLVEPGVYATGGKRADMMSRIVVPRGVTVQSSGGPERTIIVGAADPVTKWCGSNAVRCAYLDTTAVLVGFTLSNGFTDVLGENKAWHGGGASMQPGSSLVSCIVTRCTARSWGGGVSAEKNCHISHCRFVDNRASQSGGGIFARGAVVTSCSLSNNRAERDGGICALFASVVENCVLVGNSARLSGAAVGGRDNSTINNCVIAASVTRDGAALHLSPATARYCLLLANASYSDDGIAKGPGGEAHDCGGFTLVAGLTNAFPIGPVLAPTATQVFQWVSVARDRIASLQPKPDDRTADALYERRLAALQTFVGQICARYNVTTNELQRIYLRGVQERWPVLEK